jgi:hypothetical protein
MFSQTLFPLVSYLIEHFPYHCQGAHEYYSNMSGQEQNYIIDYVQRCTSLGREFADKSDIIFQEHIVILPYINFFCIWNEPTFSQSKQDLWWQLHHIFVFAMQEVLGYERYNIIFKEVKEVGWLQEPINESEHLLSMILASMNRDEAFAQIDLDGVEDENSLDIPSLLKGLKTSATQEKIDPEAFLKTRVGIIVRECTDFLGHLCQSFQVTPELTIGAIMAHLQRIDKMQIITLVMDSFSTAIVEQQGKGQPSVAAATESVSQIHDKLINLLYTYVPAETVEGSILRQFCSFASPKLIHLLQSAQLSDVIEEFGTILPQSMQSHISKIMNMLKVDKPEQKDHAHAHQDHKRQEHELESSILDMLGMSKSEFARWKSILEHYIKIKQFGPSSDPALVAQSTAELNKSLFAAIQPYIMGQGAGSAHPALGNTGDPRAQAKREHLQREHQRRQGKK